MSFARLKAVILPICAVAVLLFSSTVTVFASEDYVQVLGSDIGGTFYFEDTILTQFAGTNELVVPLYYTMFINNVEYNHYQYISGFFRCNDPLYYSGVTFPAKTSIVFEPLYESLRVNNRGNVLRLFFDNYHPVPEGQQLLLGYYHVYLPSVTVDTNYNLTSASSLVAGVANSFLRITDYEYGYTNAVVNAIESSSSIDHLESILLDIEDDTDSLSSILSALQQSNSYLYSYLPVIISNLQNVKSSVDNDVTVDTGILNKIKDIYDLLNEHFDTETNKAKSQAADANSKLGDLSEDIAVTKPTGVAGLADGAVNNVLTEFDTTNNSTVFGWLSNNIVLVMLTLVFSFAVLSYLLYGGK